MIITGDDVLFMIGLLLLSAGACAVATIAAVRLGLVQMASQLLVDASPDSAAIDELGRIADIARSEGLISAEAAAAGSHLPLLSRGLGLAVGGLNPVQIRERLATHIEFGLSRSTRARLRLATACLYGTLLGAVLLVAMISLKTPTAWAVLALPALACVGLAPTLIDRLGAPASRGVLLRMMVVEAIARILEGSDGNAIRTELGNWLTFRLLEGTSGAIAA